MTPSTTIGVLVEPALPGFTGAVQIFFRPPTVCGESFVSERLSRVLPRSYPNIDQFVGPASDTVGGTGGGSVGAAAPPMTGGGGSDGVPATPEGGTAGATTPGPVGVGIVG